MLKIAIPLINDSIVNTLINCVLVVISQGGNLFLNKMICIILSENTLKFAAKTTQISGKKINEPGKLKVVMVNKVVLKKAWISTYIP